MLHHTYKLKSINISIKILILCLLGLIVTCLTVGLTACHSGNQAKVGIIVPIENKSLDEIVAGFEDALKAKFPAGLKIKIANAQGDFNLQRTILMQMKHEQYDLIVPIGTNATEMAASAIRTQPIVSLAANYSQADREKRKSCNIAVVHDEIPPQEIIKFVHQVYPELTHLTLIHSASDKIFSDVAVAIGEAHALGITVKPILVPTLNELYSAVNAIPKDSQGVLILKDLLIASGINTVKIAAEKRGLPLIASDEGSVQEGASFALGISERSIGEKGASLAAAILLGQSACHLPIVDLKQFTVFINRTNKNPEQIQPIIQAAKQMHFVIQYKDSSKPS